MTEREWRAEVAKALVLKSTSMLRMATDLGYSQDYLSKVIRGKRKGLPAVSAVSRYLGIEDYTRKEEA